LKAGCLDVIGGDGVPVMPTKVSPNQIAARVVMVMLLAIATRSHARSV
jgi:hypothetical protein